MSTTETRSKKAYNFAVTAVTDANVGVNANGKTKITFRGKTKIQGREVERTIVAQGQAAPYVEGKIAVGEVINLRCVFDRAPANEDGTPGGEYLSVVGVPTAKAA